MQPPFSKELRIDQSFDPYLEISLLESDCRVRDLPVGSEFYRSTHNLLQKESIGAHIGLIYHQSYRQHIERAKIHFSNLDPYTLDASYVQHSIGSYIQALHYLDPDLAIQQSATYLTGHEKTATFEFLVTNFLQHGQVIDAMNAYHALGLYESNYIFTKVRLLQKITEYYLQNGNGDVLVLKNLITDCEKDFQSLRNLSNRTKKEEKARGMILINLAYLHGLIGEDPLEMLNREHISFPNRSFLTTSEIELRTKVAIAKHIGGLAGEDLQDIKDDIGLTTITLQNGTLDSDVKRGPLTDSEYAIQYVTHIKTQLDLSFGLSMLNGNTTNHDMLHILSEAAALTIPFLTPRGKSQNGPVMLKDNRELYLNDSMLQSLFLDWSTKCFDIFYRLSQKGSETLDFSRYHSLKNFASHQLTRLQVSQSHLDTINNVNQFVEYMILLNLQSATKIKPQNDREIKKLMHAYIYTENFDSFAGCLDDPDWTDINKQIVIDALLSSRNSKNLLIAKELILKNFCGDFEDSENVIKLIHAIQAFR